MKFTVLEVAQILAKYQKAQFMTVTERWIRKNLKKLFFYRLNMFRWAHSFFETRNLAYRGGNSRPGSSKQKAEQARDRFQSGTALSIRKVACILDLSFSTILRILRNCLFLSPFWLQKVQALVAGDIEDGWNFLSTVHFTQTVTLVAYQRFFSANCIFRMNEVSKKQIMRIAVTRSDAAWRPFIPAA